MWWWALKRVRAAHAIERIFIAKLRENAGGEDATLQDEALMSPAELAAAREAQARHLSLIRTKSGKSILHQATREISLAKAVRSPGRAGSSPRWPS